MPKPLWAIAWSETAGVQTLSNIDELKATYADPTSKVWVDLQDADRDLLDAVSKIFGLHPLVTEDILERNQRAKVELTNDTLHVVIFKLTYEGEVVAHELDMPDVHVVVLSGRTSRDVASRVRVGGVTYVGNHGMRDRLSIGTTDLSTDLSATFTACRLAKLSPPLPFRRVGSGSDSRLCHIRAATWLPPLRLRSLQ